MPAAIGRPFLLGWAAYGIVYFACGFHPGLVASDDFGYLRSILGTLAAHRPYVYDWLEPYAATYSGACALLYLLTGHFLASAWGFQALCAMAFYPLLARLLAARLRPGQAALLALAVAGFPLFFAKAADFHAAFCTLDLVLLSLMAFEARRWHWFFLAAFFAFANRQNQVCLLILPWAHALREARQGRTVTRAIPLGTLAWVAAAAILVLSMNPTYAAAHAAYRHQAPASLALHAALALAAGGYMALGWLSLGSYFAGRPAAWRGGLGAALPCMLAAAGLLALIPAWGPSLLLTDTPFFGMLGWPLVNRVLPWILLLLLPLLDFRLLRHSPYLALIMAYVLLASLRGTWWDYYFLEIALVALLLALEGIPAPALPRPAMVLLVVSLVADAGYAYFYKIQNDKQVLAMTALERLEREGRAPTEALTGAPFGLLGWKLFGYFIAHDGAAGGNLTDFLGYVSLDRIRIDTGLPWRRGFKADLKAGVDSLGGGEGRVGFATVRYRIVDLHGPRADLAPLGRALRLDSSFRAPRYPLDDGEWDRLIRTGSLP